MNGTRWNALPGSWLHWESAESFGLRSGVGVREWDKMALPGAGSEGGRPPYQHAANTLPTRYRQAANGRAGEGGRGKSKVWSLKSKV